MENYKNAYKEVYIILNNMESRDVSLIPKTFLELLKNNMNTNYNFKLDSRKNFREQQLLKETKVILAYIFLNYWSTAEQKARIEEKFKYDISKNESTKKKYTNDEIFKIKKN